MKRAFTALLLLSVAGSLASCGEPQAPPQAQPREVGTIVAHAEPVTLTVELPGRTAAYERSDVRPQVSGIILKRLFQEGDRISAGQPLYQIDPLPYQSSVASARAGLARAQATIASTQALAKRYASLVTINAISRQEYENAEAAARQAVAEVEAQRAALRSAEIDLQRTTLRAPISGIIGVSRVTPGALVTAGQAEALTTIERLDPIYVDVTPPANDYLNIRRMVASGELSRNEANSAVVKLILEDRTTYPLSGKLQFAGATVDESTGTVTVRAIFPNPQHLLLPGMYVRASLVEGTTARAFLIPQQAVTRDERGRPVAYVVGKDNKLEARVLTAPRVQGTNWIVTEGLKDGERIAVDGVGMLQPGTVVKPVAWKPPVTGTGAVRAPGAGASGANQGAGGSGAAGASGGQD